MDTLLSYSKGIDLADQGKLQEASVQLASVVSKAPMFVLARERHEQLLARLKEAQERRTETLTDVNELLGQHRRSASSRRRTWPHSTRRKAPRTSPGGSSGCSTWRYSQELYRRLMTQGYKAARELFVEVDPRCGENKELKPYLRSLLTSAALSAAQAHDRTPFHELMTTRFLALNGSQSDTAGYLKNYVPHCQKAEPAAP